MTRRAAALALAALCATACAGPRFRSSVLDGWHAVETGGVRIVAEAGADELTARARDLARFDAAFAALISRRIPPTGPTTIYLVRDPELAGHLGLSRFTGGYAMTTFDGAFAWVLLRPNPVETRLVLFHEITHLILSRHRSSRIPRWYNEGLAEYFSTLAFRDGALVVGATPTERVLWLSQRAPLPLERLFADDPGDDAQAALDFYATSWALAHYLLGSPSGRRELARFDKELSQGAALDAAREAAFGRPFDRLSEELATHVGFLLRGVAAEMVLDPRSAVIAEPPAPLLLGRAETARELGALALALADPSEEPSPWTFARALLDVAVDADPENARARAGLAWARAEEGDPDGAEAILAGALRDAPADPQVQIDAGRAALAAGAADPAQARFRRALALDERSGSAWLGLGRALAAGGRPDAAVGALERARSLGASAALDLELGRLYLAAGRTDDAEVLLMPLAQDSHGGPIAEQAAELLRGAGLLPEAANEKR